MMEKQEQNNTSKVRQQSENDPITRLEIMYNQIRDLELGLLLSGLTILVKDTAAYLTSQGIDSETAEGFRLAYLDMLNHDRFYWEKFWPQLYGSEKEVVAQKQEFRLPHGIEGVVKDAGNCKADLRAFSNCELEKEWWRAPGWYFFKIYMGQRREDILRDVILEIKPAQSQENTVSDTPFKALKRAFCNNKDPYEKPPEDSCKQTQEEEADNPFTPVEAVVHKLIGTERQVREFWFPVMLFLVVLLEKTDFMTLEDTLR